MNYPPAQYSFAPDHSVHIVHQSSMHYSHHTSQPPQHHDRYFLGHSHTDFADFGQHSSLQDEFDDGGEVSTRPRLTKEQVDVLESQFQAQPKPNSNVKRTLAVQTKLTLPRVANWFQNRRAKAKQQKKQEEFEIKRTMGMADGWKSEGHLPSRYAAPLHLNTDTSFCQSDMSAGSDGSNNLQQLTPTSADSLNNRNSTQEASWASLQRALSAAEAAQIQQAQQQEQDFISMPPPQVAASVSLQATNPGSDNNPVQTTLTGYPEWTSNISTSSEVWPSHQAEEQAQPFDFGFDQSRVYHQSDTSQAFKLEDSPHLAPSHGFAVTAEDWATSVQSSMDLGQQFFDPANSAHQAAFQPPVYPGSRRGSGSDELTSNFGNFALVGTPPIPSPSGAATSNLESFRRAEGELDIAARRKRPRPAALGSAALRSRSFGGPPSMSPTLRIGAQSSPHHHAVRQVKSMGQNLNVRYGGIRKPSSAQRSPLNVGSFAEADAFREFLAQQTMTESKSGTSPPTPMLAEDPLAHRIPKIEETSYVNQDQTTPHEYHLNGQPINFPIASPPMTPLNTDLKTEFMHPGHVQAMMPPISAPPQYAVFPDHTPPYSAGPLTSSSWSDAPFTSPGMSMYPNGVQVAHVMYPTSTHDFNPGFYQHLEMLPQPKLEIPYPPASEPKQTEFFIQEFPRQKEEHAHAAQQLAQQKPKNYVFANATPSDF